jgi:hypothetical protein
MGNFFYLEPITRQLLKRSRNIPCGMVSNFYQTITDDFIMANPTIEFAIAEAKIGMSINKKNLTWAIVDPDDKLDSVMIKGVIGVILTSLMSLCVNYIRRIKTLYRKHRMSWKIYQQANMTTMILHLYTQIYLDVFEFADVTTTSDKTGDTGEAIATQRGRLRKFAVPRKRALSIASSIRPLSEENGEFDLEGGKIENIPKLFLRH